MKTEEKILKFNELCADVLGWELFKAKSAIHNIYGSFEDWNESDWVYIVEPTEEFKKHLILSEPQEVGLDWDFKLFKDYYWKSTLKFHSDWNLIMEVKDKICGLNIVDEFNTYYDSISNGYHCTINPFYKDTFDKFQTKVFKTEKEAVINIVDQFLIWYNKQK